MSISVFTLIQTFSNKSLHYEMSFRVWVTNCQHISGGKLIHSIYHNQVVAQNLSSYLSLCQSESEIVLIRTLKTNQNINNFL